MDQLLYLLGRRGQVKPRTCVSKAQLGEFFD
jgi:hypothetical protein